MAEDLKGGTADKFTWAQATAAGVCPSGWSLPSKADFDTLIDSGECWDDIGSWWSTKELDETDAYRLHITAVATAVNTSPKSALISVRCLKD
jgi:hypothetical protein